MGVSSCELASHLRRIVDGERHLVVQYWLLRVTAPGGLTTFAVLAAAREICAGSLAHEACELAGLGADAVAARALYGRLVGGAALPVHLPDLVADGRCALGGASSLARLAAARPTPQRV